MKRIKPRLYQVVVNTPQGGAGHWVTTYFIEASERFVAFDYIRFTYTLPDSAHAPLSTDFKEQLRAVDEASDVADISRENETSRIEEKMRETYGTDAEMDIQQINHEF